MGAVKFNGLCRVFVTAAIRPSGTRRNRVDSQGLFLVDKERSTEKDPRFPRMPKYQT